MKQILFKQPNGLYGVFSQLSNTILKVNLMEDEIDVKNSLMKTYEDVIALIKDSLIPSPYYFDRVSEKEAEIMNDYFREKKNDFENKQNQMNSIKDGNAYCLVKKLKNEFDALNNRINKLKAFMETETYETLAVDEKIDLNQQLEYMNGYANILNKRIERHTSKQTNNE